MLTRELTFRSYKTADRMSVLRLLQRSARAHIHFDWQSPDECLADPAVIGCLGIGPDAPQAALMLSAPLAGNTWVRLLALDYGISIAGVSRQMWECVTDRLRAEDVAQASILLQDSWSGPVAESLGFRPIDQVVTLRWDAAKADGIPSGWVADHVISRAVVSDLDAVLAVDTAAFDPHWRLSVREAQAAWRSAGMTLVARRAERVVGYAMGTTHGPAGHVARLATHPAAQGLGVGNGLLRALLGWFLERQIRHVTVNTQRSNSVSLRLYSRCGFVPSGYTLPVMSLALT